jgi:uncharacterized protein YdaU (DUF1376 family)
MSKIFRFDCYPHDWLLDTSRLTPEDRGIYVQIVMLIYARGGQIDNDPKWISGSCNCSSRFVAGCISRLIQMGFIQLSDGKIAQKRAERELKSKRTQIEKGANGGRNNAEQKPQSGESNNLVPKAEPTDPRSTNPSPSPIPINPPIPPSTQTPDYFGRNRLDPQIPPAWLSGCQTEMGWAENVAMDIWTKFSGHQGRKNGQSALKTIEEWAADWRTWYRKENIKPSQKVIGQTDPVVILTEEQQEQQRKWHRKMGVQHKIYNPDGVREKEPVA